MNADFSAVKNDVQANGLTLNLPPLTMNNLMKTHKIDITDFYDVQVTLTPLHTFCEARSYSGEQALNILFLDYKLLVTKHIEDKLSHEVWRLASAGQILSDIIEKSKQSRIDAVCDLER